METAEAGKNQCRVCLENVCRFYRFTELLSDTEETIQTVFEFCIKTEFPSSFQNVGENVLCIPCTKILRFVYDFLRQAVEAESSFRRTTIHYERQAPPSQIELQPHIDYGKPEPVPVHPFSHEEPGGSNHDLFPVNNQMDYEEEEEKKPFLNVENAQWFDPQPTSQTTDQGHVQGFFIDFNPESEESTSSTTGHHNSSKQLCRKNIIKPPGSNPMEQYALVCTKCESSFPTKKEFNKHILDMHKDAQDLQCNICQKIFTKPRNFIEHLRIHIGRNFQCQLCEKSFTKSKRLDTHMVSHTNIKPFRCNHCEKAFTSEGYLNEHVRIHQDLSYKCEFCDSEFKSYKSLKDHKILKHFKCPYQCPNCSKGFLSKKLFKEHLLRYETKMTDEEIENMRIQNSNETKKMKLQLKETTENTETVTTSIQNSEDLRLFKDQQDQQLEQNEKEMTNEEIEAWRMNNLNQSKRIKVELEEAAETIAPTLHDPPYLE